MMLSSGCFVSLCSQSVWFDAISPGVNARNILEQAGYDETVRTLVGAGVIHREKAKPLKTVVMYEGQAVSSADKFPKGEAVCTAIFRYIPSCHVIEVLYMATALASVRQGFGRMMVTRILKDAQDQGAKFMVIAVDKTSATAESFWVNFSCSYLQKWRHASKREIQEQLLPFEEGKVCHMVLDVDSVLSDLSDWL